MTGNKTPTPNRGKQLLANLRKSRPQAATTPASGDVPLSLAQQTLLASQELHPDQAVGNITHAWDLRGPLDADALERAFGRLVARHDALRMSVRRDHGRALAAFAARLPVALPCTLPEGEDPATRLEAALARIHADQLNGIDLDADRLWRARLYRVGADHHLLAVTIHHLICDDWSWRILPRDLFALYRVEIGEVAEPDLPPVTPFRSYLAARAELAGVQSQAPANDRPEIDRPEIDWPEIDWPVTEQGLPDRLALQPGTVATHLPAPDFDRLKQVARVHNCTAFTFFLAAYQLLLHLYCDQQALGISSSIDDRAAGGGQQAIGALIRDVQLGASLSGHRTFAELLEACNGAVQAARARADDGISLGRATIGYYNAPGLEVAAGPIAVRECPVTPGVTAINLHLDLVPGADGVRIELVGQRRHFDQARLEALLACYLRILDQVARNPAMPLAGIALLPPDAARLQGERATQLPDLPPLDTLAGFAAMAEAHPDAVAIETPTSLQSYRALDAETDAWAQWLRVRGLAEGDRIGVFAPRGTLVFKAWLAALKAGLVVVPMDFDLTENRLGDMLREARCRWVIGPPSGRRITRAGEVNFLTPPGATDLQGLPAACPARSGADPRRDAFVMFTSGTTGAPKSIPISHQGLVRLALDTPHLPVGPGDRMIQLASPGFDGSFIELWGAWLTGATLVLCEKPVLSEGGVEVEFRKLAPTASFMTTSLFNMLVDADPGVLAPLKYLAVGGEAVSADHCRRALAAHPDLVLSNVYGPTENTSLSTAYRIGAGDPGASMPIGRPLPGNVATVLSTYMTPVPDGFAGELLVGGPGLARGYENRPDLSGQKFLALDAARLGLPLEGPVTLYRTGDRARWTPEGQLEFMGRRDTQFKLHGYRIEPTEVEGAIMEHPTVGRAAVIADVPEGQDRAIGIIAFVELREGAALDLPALRAFLATRLPRPIRPTRYVEVAAIPLTRNGKADTRTLADLARSDARARAGQPAARDRLTAIWQKHLDLFEIPDDVDFYALGGTSLSLVRMVLEVEEAFDAQIDFAAISEEPTLRRLRFLVSLSPAPSGAGLRHLRVLKQGDPDLPPLILMPTANGAAAWAVDIAAQMETRHPVLALSFDPKDGSLPDGADRFRHMVQAFLADIRAHAGDGPVTLAGYSFGGALAVQLAGLARDVGVTVARIINIDGGCPTAWAAPRDDAQEAPGGAEGLFDRQFQRQPSLPVDVPFHLVTATRGFPFARADLGAAWSYLSRVEIVEHAFDLHHAQLPIPPFAQGTAGCLDRILDGSMPVTRRHPPRFDGGDMVLLNQVRTLSHGGDLAGAIDLLEPAIHARRDAPEWMCIALVRLLRQAGRTDALARLQADPPPGFRTPAVLEALQLRAGAHRPALLRMGHEASGADQSGAIALFERYVEQGQEREARAILTALEASPRHGIEAAIARAVATGLWQKDEGGFDQASRQLTALLSGAEADHTHVRWGAVFLARNGHVDAALDLLDVERNRFPGPMQQARAHIERSFRRLTPAQLPPPMAPAPARPGRLKRFLRGVVAGR